MALVENFFCEICHDEHHKIIQLQRECFGGGWGGLFDFHLGAKHSMYLGHVSLTFSNIFLEMKFFVSRMDLVRVTEL